MNVQMSPRNARLSKTQRAIAEASALFHIPKHEVLTGTWSGHAAARQYVYLRLWSEGMSLPQIGNAMGKHHTTILHGARAAAKRLMEESNAAKPTEF